MMRQTRSHRRRGVLLLIVLGMLAMFGLVCMTFVLVSSQHRRSGESARRIGEYTDDPATLLDEAFGQVVRGPNEPVLNNANGYIMKWPRSAVGAHSLLETMYGNRSRCGYIAPPSASTRTPFTSEAGGEIIQFPASGWSELGYPAPLDNDVIARSGGCVLTFLNGFAPGASTRIVCVSGSAGNRIFHVLATKEITFQALQSYFTSSQMPLKYLVNGPAFGGVGIGLNQNGGHERENDVADPMKQNVQYNRAYLPKSPYNRDTELANSDYTAVDHQHMLLGMALPAYLADANNAWALHRGVSVPIPSMHRSEVLSYWIQQEQAGVNFRTLQDPLAAATYLRDEFARDARRRRLLYRSVMRPLSVFHPKFTGSNPFFNPFWDGLTFDASSLQAKPFCQWDVDNDGDGINDSVWIDAGFAVRSAPDGRLYKPLIAVLCLDLDGRINLNAHGSLAHAINIDSNNAESANNPVPFYATPKLTANYDVRALPPYGGLRFSPGDPTSIEAMLPRGQGYGPAEINMAMLFRATPQSPPNIGSNSWHRFIFKGNPGGSNGNPPAVLGRYGESPTLNFPGARPGAAGMMDSRFFNQWFEYGSLDPATKRPPVHMGDFWSFLSPNPAQNRNPPSTYHPDAYGSPPDIEGMGAVGLDPGGKPIFWESGRPSISKRTNTYQSRSYEIDLNREAARLPDGRSQTIDLPFLPSEVERLLRVADPDSVMLPQRLSTLCDRLPRLRNEVTTESWDVPCPGGRHILDLINEGRPEAGTNLTSDQLRMFLPPEVLAGLRFDINFPFGNGRDDNGDGVVDERGETETPIFSDKKGNLLQGQMSSWHRHPWGNTALGTATSLQARELYARYLYCLACLAIQEEGRRQLIQFVDTNPMMVRAMPGLAGAQRAARLLAQWAVNVVDFRDRDSIMTLFRYFPDFFSTPQPWPDLTDPRMKIVYGCERPELLLTETIAFHDRRTQDTDQEVVDREPGQSDKRVDPGKVHPDDPKTVNEKNEDWDFDQQWRPQGSLFVELFNPWSPTDAPTGEFNARRSASVAGVAGTTTWTSGVRLNQKTPAGQAVWRMAVVPTHRAAKLRASQFPNLEQTDPDRLALQLVGTGAGGAAPTPPPTTRFVYFTERAAIPTERLIDTSTEVSCYFPSEPERIAPVLPGRYAVVGPGGPDYAQTGVSTTYIGFAQGQEKPTPEARRIVLRAASGGVNPNPDTPNQVEVLNNSNRNGTNDLPPMPGIGGNANYSIKPPVSVVIDRGYAQSGGVRPVRLSVSEPPPNKYYPDRGPDGELATSEGKYGRPYDHPLDRFEDGNANKPLLRGMDGDVSWEYLNKTRTYYRYCLVHLQRLADPSRNYNGDRTSPDFNPYLTIDSLPVDLTAFNGTKDLKDAPCDDSDKLPEQLHAERPRVEEVRFAAFERGVSEYQKGRYFGDLWKQEPLNTLLNQRAGYPKRGGDNFSFEFTNSFGYLNGTFGLPRQESDPRSPYLGDPTPDTNFGPDLFTGRPRQACPFPWFTWNNRPFVSPWELMLVPWMHSSRLLHPENFSMVSEFATSGVPYYGNLYTGNSINFNERLFNHLPSFFNQQYFLSRVLEYLRVPSRFVGTQVHLNPLVTAGGDTHPFHMPYHRISTYREPGRLNVNTIFSQPVWQGLMNGWPHGFVINGDGFWGGNTAAFLYNYGNSGAQPVPLNNMWRKFLESRRGYNLNLATAANPPNAATDNLRALLAIDPTAPSRFAMPFRSLAWGQRRDPQINGEIRSTMFRNDFLTPGLTGRPLFELDAETSSFGKQILAADHPMNPDRNPYFRYSGLQRLCNLTTTRSNVYAVWITVGYFEVEPNIDDTPGSPTANQPVPDEFRPDGYRLCKELGSETGDIKRHRAFYIFDRTVPMGFIRGQNVNLDKGTLIKRYIE